MATSDKSFNGELLESIFKTSKKTIQEYVREIERNNRYRSCRQDTGSGYILDDRARLIDLYEACLQQDAHIRSVVETLESQILGDRYMLARVNEKGKYIKDVANSLKIQGSQFDKIIKGIVESKLYGYTLLEIMPHTDPRTGRLAEVNIIERRNVLPDQKTVLKRQGLWEPHWDLHDPAYYRCYVLVNSGDLGLFSATTPLILAKKFTVANYVNFSHTYGQPIIHGKTVSESNADRKRLANEIANAAQNKVVVTGIEDAGGVFHPFPVRARKALQGRAARRAVAAFQPADARRRECGRAPRRLHRPLRRTLRRSARDADRPGGTRRFRQFARHAARREPP